MARPKKDFAKQRSDLARLYDEGLAEFRAVIKSCEESSSFYSNGTVVPAESLPSFVLDRQGGLLDILSEITDITEENGKEIPASDEQFTAFVELTADFLITADDLLSFAKPFDLQRISDAAEGVKSDFHFRYWLLLRIAVFFRLIEMHQMIKKANNWPILKKLILSNPSEASDELYTQWVNDIYNKRDILFDTISALNRCCVQLKPSRDKLMVAFSNSYRNGEDFFRIDSAVKSVLTARRNLHLFHPTSVWCWQPIRHMDNALHAAELAIVNVVKGRAEEPGINEKTRRLWTNVMAEFAIYMTNDNRLPDDAEADHIIALANNAAKESWVEARFKTEQVTQPIPVRLVDVAPSAGKGLREAMKEPGGRPKKTHGGAKVMTQAEMATAFGEPCNEAMVANWEARAAGKKRGANPPDALYNNERIIYSAELRLNPTPDNQKRLTALIVEFQSRHRIKDAIGRKALHMKSAETLALKSGQIDAAIRERGQLKYEK